MENNEKFRPRPAVISVSYKDEELIFEDDQGNCGRHIKTKVWRGKLVTWDVETKGLEITKIYHKEDSQNIFVGHGPVERGNGTWGGKIREDVNGSEAYNVDYTINGKPQTADPDLDVQEDDGNG
jgi:hypothetical protein